MHYAKDTLAILSRKTIPVCKRKDADSKNIFGRSHSLGNLQQTLRAKWTLEQRLLEERKQFSEEMDKFLREIADIKFRGSNLSANVERALECLETIGQMLTDCATECQEARTLNLCKRLADDGKRLVPAAEFSEGRCLVNKLSYLLACYKCIVHDVTGLNTPWIANKLFLRSDKEEDISVAFERSGSSFLGSLHSDALSENGRNLFRDDVEPEFDSSTSFQKVRCRICEELVDSHSLEIHTKICVCDFKLQQLASVIATKVRVLKRPSAPHLYLRTNSKTAASIPAEADILRRNRDEEDFERLLMLKKTAERASRLDAAMSNGARSKTLLYVAGLLAGADSPSDQGRPADMMGLTDMQGHNGSQVPTGQLAAQVYALIKEKVSYLDPGLTPQAPLSMSHPHLFRPRSFNAATPSSPSRPFSPVTWGSLTPLGPPSPLSMPASPTGSLRRLNSPCIPTCSSAPLAAPAPLSRTHSLSPHPSLLSPELSRLPPALIPRAVQLRGRRCSAGSATINDFEILKLISQGAFGRVFLAKKKRTGDIFAIKVLKKADMVRKNQAEHVKAERNVLAVSHNPFVVKMYFSFQSKQYLYLVMEYLNGGDCYSLLRKAGFLPEDMARQYAAECVLALDYLHKRGIVHRDIKPDNMLINHAGHIKLTDFGLCHIHLDASLLNDPSSHEAQAQDKDKTAEGGSRRGGNLRKSIGGTPDYLAPECLTSGHDGPSVDWWALGVVLYEMLTGTPPFNGDTPQLIFHNILKHPLTWPDFPDVSEAARDLVEKLLERDASKRLGAHGAADIQQHPFFAGVDFSTLLERTADFVPCTDDVMDTSYFEVRGAAMACEVDAFCARNNIGSFMDDHPDNPDDQPQLRQRKVHLRSPSSSDGSSSNADHDRDSERRGRPGSCAPSDSDSDASGPTKSRWPGGGGPDSDPDRDSRARRRRGRHLRSSDSGSDSGSDSARSSEAASPRGRDKERHASEDSGSHPSIAESKKFLGFSFKNVCNLEEMNMELARCTSHLHSSSSNTSLSNMADGTDSPTLNFFSAPACRASPLLRHGQQPVSSFLSAPSRDPRARRNSLPAPRSATEVFMLTALRNSSSSTAASPRPSPSPPPIRMYRRESDPAPSHPFSNSLGSTSSLPPVPASKSLPAIRQPSASPSASSPYSSSSRPPLPPSVYFSITPASGPASTYASHCDLLEHLPTSPVPGAAQVSACFASADSPPARIAPP